MDIGKAFTFVFEDPEWIKKIAIGALIFLIPLVGPFVIIGYMLVAMKNVADGQQYPMPDWGNFGGYLVKGIYAAVGSLIYFIPVILIACCVGALSMLGFGAAAGTSGSGSSAAEGVGGAMALLSMCLYCLMALFAVVASLTSYAPMVRFAMTDNQLAVFWDFRGNLEFIRNNMTDYLIAFLLTLVASFVAGLGTIACGVGVLFTAMWGYMIIAHVFGQFWRNAVSRGTAPAI